MAGEPSWFELGVGDVERGRAFYGGLFGWGAEELPGGGLVLRTDGAPGGMHGGDAGAVAMAFFAVDDLDAALLRVAELGGAHVPMGEVDADAAPLGRFAICRDDQGSLFGLHEPPAG